MQFVFRRAEPTRNAPGFNTGVLRGDREKPRLRISPAHPGAGRDLIIPTPERVGRGPGFRRDEQVVGVFVSESKRPARESRPLNRLEDRLAAATGHALNLFLDLFFDDGGQIGVEPFLDQGTQHLNDDVLQGPARSFGHPHRLGKIGEGA